ncbi:hypothetical protein C8Q76DRAFT_794852 [Earliella scabrosa]|nr:hypothetical protein C8Q76DRAFT_794852 [Earliella scabrosa]
MTSSPSPQLTPDSGLFGSADWATTASLVDDTVAATAHERYLPQIPPPYTYFNTHPAPVAAPALSAMVPDPLAMTVPDPPAVTPTDVKVLTMPRMSNSTRTDANADPPICLNCGRVFTLRRNLRAHMKEVHNHDNTFVPTQCPKCPCKYKWASDLKRHIAQKHPEYGVAPVPVASCS